MDRYFNPFVIGKYAGKEYFCDRVEETKLLKHHLENGRNVTIMSERRMGKTGLIEHTFTNALKEDDYYTFIIDIYTAKNLREMVCLLANEIFKKIVRKQSLLAKLTQIVQSLKTTIKYNGITGEPEVEFGLGEIVTPELTLDELFAYMEQADKPCIVAIDEFQKITDFDEDNIEAILRTKIQHLRNTQFVFAGSERHLLEGIFNDSSRPFYNSVVFMQLLPIDRKEYLEFCKRLFAENNKEVQEAFVNGVYDYFNGVTWYMQLSMNEAFSLTLPKSSIGIQQLQTVLTHMVDTKRFTFEDKYASLTEKQKAVIKAMANEYPSEVSPTSKDFILRHNLKTASSVQTAMKGLMDKGIVNEWRGNKRITDLLFVLWLKKF
ncbi:MAG: ATP-binding protein [Bacteroidaceae bacterium]|nr:ATP-binding protein [Bacteroidaceae bacterium]